MSVILEHQDGVAVLRIGADENRFSSVWLDSVEQALEDVLASDSTVLLSVAEGKFYSNGLDLDWVQKNLAQFDAYAARVQLLLARLLTLPLATVAAVNGHAFGAGAMLAMAHDFRIMRADRGFFCFPEVDIRIPFTPGMASLIQAKLTPQAAVASMTTGRRLGGPEALELGIVDRIDSEAELFAAAKELAASLAGKDRETLGKIKTTMFGAAETALRNF